MKIGAIYTVYNGLELLEGSIKQIYKHVDEIVIVWQDVSNKGESNNDVFNFVDKLQYSFSKVRLCKFVPNLNIDTKTNELNKHNLGLKVLRELYCTHFFLSATDHYYLQEEFVKAKQTAEKYDVTLTSMFTYYKYPEWQLTPIEDYYMPFICKLNTDTQYVKKRWILRVDPSVKINTDTEMYLFKPEEIMMHHYSMIRENINNKFKNAAASIRWKKEDAELFEYEFLNYDLKINPGIRYFGGRKIKLVSNYFNIKSKIYS